MRQFDWPLPQLPTLRGRWCCGEMGVVYKNGDGDLITKANFDAIEPAAPAALDMLREWPAVVSSFAQTQAAFASREVRLSGCFVVRTRCFTDRYVPCACELNVPCPDTNRLCCADTCNDCYWSQQFLCGFFPVCPPNCPNRTDGKRNTWEYSAGRGSGEFQLVLIDEARGTIAEYRLEGSHGLVPSGRENPLNYHQRIC